METKLLYLEDFARLECDAKVIDIGRIQEDQKMMRFHLPSDRLVNGKTAL